MTELLEAGVPITPDQIGHAQRVALPPVVVDTWNTLIAQHWSGGSAKIMQNEAVTDLMAATGLSRTDVFDKHYLDIEQMYRDAGWKVEYDKPGYNESYEASFTFSKGRAP